MTDWWTKLVVGGEGNVIRERAFTNWNAFDASKILAEKEKEREREKASSVRTSVEADAASNGGNSERD
jgi:hypothetical protein